MSLEVKNDTTIAYLRVQSGPEKGRQFTLDPDRPMHIGRGKNCEIMLTDPISSRFHAVIFHEEGGWHLRDTSSRNGTLVNGQKTDHARLVHHNTVTIGATELQMIELETESSEETSLTETFSHDDFKTERSWLAGDEDPLAHVAATGYLIDLYSLSLSLLRCNDSDEVIDTLVKLLRDRTQADVVGLTFDSGDGQLKPRRVEPPEAQDEVVIEKSLVRRIVREGEAIWINDLVQSSATSSRSPSQAPPWADIIYAPLICEGTNLGVLHLYRRKPKFTQSQFELAVAAARLLAIGLSQAFERDSLKAERNRIADRNADSDELIGSSPIMVKLKERIVRVGSATGSVLIRGESGSGKELVARAVHRASRRSKRPMLTVNCAAIPHDLIESQLFGHRKGSFTGADSDHIGWFQQAHTGTLFLDEIGELTLEGQAKLLRILEGHPFLPVGATEEVLVDVRVIAATNRDLAEFVREKRFREDLFYRLSVFELAVPPLRDRGRDIELLMNHFLEHFRRQHGRPLLGLSDEAQCRLLEYPWPGNVRQLRNVIDSAVVMADDPAIEGSDLGLRDAGLSRLDTLRLDEWEKRLIRKAVERTSGSVPEAARLLGISRATAYRKITEYEIKR
ncbi:sigma 54-interacting transcriptional regulator [Novipirellula artificiosorum]|uniref:Transcriptional regulatory protein ZraR n=1 Tax=Novipirellula artificiosorum TaxID=2528016 RepID=A0A5C6DC09_9BACT|nr:sigma 54-interacting transcriptional regulator [Novipirellula artificiosorum]TWU33745.1 Transcriptional regulatory protein ZraR [Novipirellula artificiosorum]